MLNELSELVNDEQEKVFQLIKDQFQNADISCRIVKERLNWHIEVTAVVIIGEIVVKRRRYVITRRTWELFQQSDEELARAIENVVFTLKHAMSHEVFINPNAPSLEYKEQE